MKRKIFTILLVLLVIVSSVGCIKPEESPIYTEFDDEPFELTMAVNLFLSYEHLLTAARLYEFETGIKVNIENNYIRPDYDNYDYLDPYPDTDIYTEQVLASLLTGTGADIYDVRYLDFQNLGRNGLLADMSVWLESDVNLTEDIVFRDILLSTKTENSVFAVPIDFMLSRLRAASSDEPPLPNKHMTWKEFFDVVGGSDYTKDRAYAGLDIYRFMDRFVSRASYFIDETGKTNNLDSAEMISLLEECREWAETGLCGDARDLDAYLNGSFSYSGVSVGYFNSIADMLCTLPDEYERVSEGYYAGCYTIPTPIDSDPIVTDGIERYPELHNYWTGLYGVNAGSPRAEAAQDFLRFLLSPEIQEEITHKPPPPGSHITHNGFYIPVNRAAFRNMMDRDLQRAQAHRRDLELDFPALMKEAEDNIDQIAYFITEKPYYRTIIYKVARQYFLDEISAEEAAKQMSDKVGLYLKELG